MFRRGHIQGQSPGAVLSQEGTSLTRSLCSSLINSMKLGACLSITVEAVEQPNKKPGGGEGSRKCDGRSTARFVGGRTWRISGRLDRRSLRNDSIFEAGALPGLRSLRLCNG
jgi:hypothetical protein